VRNIFMESQQNGSLTGYRKHQNKYRQLVVFTALLRSNDWRFAVTATATVT